MLGIICTLATVGTLAFVGTGFLSDSPTIELKADEWECAKHETRTSMVPVIIGKVLVMMPMTSRVCVLYSRR